MVESKYSDLNPADTTICELQKKSIKDETADNKAETQFWYADKGDSSGAGCSGSAITKKLTDAKETDNGLGGQKIASGKLLKATSPEEPKKGSITSATEGPEYSKIVDLSQRTINTTTGHDTKYYYLLVKYPNESSTDQSKTDVKKRLVLYILFYVKKS